ncbi:SRPBCC domain-containing protein [Luedemannella flava]|uniref:SRPBCC domain-containing protein n=1 Tax=Luedemannella flava TaxID=349316 RepID=A0ABN2MF49_9ACTN
MTGLVSTAMVTVDAPPERVWDALTDPATIERYLMGARVTADWTPGSPITWEGEFDGRPYADKGEVLAADPGRLLQVSHYSPLSGQPDEPESYHTLTYVLDTVAGGTRVVLTQDNNASTDEVAHTGAFWQAMLDRLRDVVQRD